MASRVWRGYTSSGNAEAYEALLKSEIFAGIARQSTTNMAISTLVVHQSRLR